MADPGAATKPRYAFGPYVLDTANRRLTRAGQSVGITARVFDILVVLVEHQGQAVEKDTLIARVWGDVAVEEGNLARHVSTLRKVLGESPDDHKYIVTLPGRGYQFVAAAAVVDDGAAASAGSAPPVSAAAPPLPAPHARQKRAAAVAAAVGVLALGAAALAYVVTRSQPPAPAAAARIVVLPFTNMGAAADEYVAAGITEEITNRLTAVQALQVISRTSASQEGRLGKTAREIGLALGADYLLEGSVLWSRPSAPPERIRITAQLIRTADDSHLWAETFDREVGDLFRVQSEIAMRVVRELRSTLLAREKNVLESEPTQNLDAYRAYLQGLFVHSRPDYSEESMARSIRHFEQAVQLDPDFAEAHSALAQAHVGYFSFGYDVSRERRELARRSLERAEQLGPDLPTTYRARSGYWLRIGGDHAKALTIAQEAEQRWPNDREMVSSAGGVLFSIGRWAEAADRLARGRDLNPQLPSSHADLALILIGLRRYPEAQHAIERSLGLEPDQNLAYILQVWNTWLWKGDVAHGRTLVDNFPASTDWRFMEMQFLQALYERRFDEALAVLKPWAGTWMRDFTLVRPVVLFEGHARRLMGDAAGARTAFDAVRTLIEAEVRSTPEDGRLRATLGVAYAGLGRKEDALREARRAIELMPYPTGFDTGVVREDVALAATMAGEYGMALDELETLLATPAHFSEQLLRLDPRWAPLREQERYRKLVGATAGTSSASVYNRGFHLPRRSSP